MCKTFGGQDTWERYIIALSMGMLALDKLKREETRLFLPFAAKKQHKIILPPMSTNDMEKLGVFVLSLFVFLQGFEYVFRGSKRKWLFLSSLTALLAVSINLALRLPLDLEVKNLNDKSYLVTGCTPGGIGFEIAKTLLEWKAKRVICTMRSEEKGRELVALLPKVEVQLMELTDFSSVKRLCSSNALTNLDGLILNAGLATERVELTRDGFEEMFQVNHLAQFLLTQCMVHKQGGLNANSRVVFVSSTANVVFGKLDRSVYASAPGARSHSTLPWKGSKNVLGTYGDTKLMQILSAKAFAKRVDPRMATFYSTCPGFVLTNFQEKVSHDAMGKFIHALAKFVARTPLQGASRVIQLLTSEHTPVNGKFFDAYIPLPQSLEITAENEEWLFETSMKLVQQWM